MPTTETSGLCDRYSSEIAEVLTMIDSLGPGVTWKVGTEEDRPLGTFVFVSLYGVGTKSHPEPISIFEKDKGGSFLDAAGRAVRRYRRRQAGERLA